MTQWGKHVRKSGIVLAVATLLWTFTPDAALACEVCWGAQVDHPTVRAIGAAMLLLIGMTGFVGGGIGAFFLNVRRRTRLREPGDLMVTETGEIRKSDTPE